MKAAAINRFGPPSVLKLHTLPIPQPGDCARTYGCYRGRKDPTCREKTLAMRQQFRLEEKREVELSEEIGMNEIDDIKASGPVTVVDTFRLNWWLLALRGLIAVVFGVLAFLWPGATLLTLVWLFGAFALVNGVLSLVLAAKTPKGYPKLGSLILGGLLGILAGVFSFVMPAITALGLLILIAAWAIVTGVMELVAAVRLRKIITNEWLLFLAGIASVAFGIILLLQPAAGTLALVWLIAAWAVVFGILLMIVAFRMRNWKGVIAVRTARV
jgi:uncharacterized membrane protein HdeD (DUF308 family)